jgi:hypothetical protein
MPDKINKNIKIKEKKNIKYITKKTVLFKPAGVKGHCLQ